MIVFLSSSTWSNSSNFGTSSNIKHQYHLPSHTKPYPYHGIYFTVADFKAFRCLLVTWLIPQPYEDCIVKTTDRDLEVNQQVQTTSSVRTYRAIYISRTVIATTVPIGPPDPAPPRQQRSYFRPRSQARAAVAEKSGWSRRGLAPAGWRLVLNNYRLTDSWALGDKMEGISDIESSKARWELFLGWSQ